MITNVNKSLVDVLRSVLDQSDILRSVQKMPDDVWRVRVQEILQSDIPPGTRPWTGWKQYNES